MSLDEAALREWVHRVTHGMADRRSFLQYMMGLGLSGPFLSHLLVTSTPAQAQTPQPGAEFVPTKRGGGGKLRLLWWQAPTILNTHLAAGTKDLDASRVVCEPLAAFDPEANFVPILAADIPSLDNGGLAQDGRSVTWRLKQDVLWHDGKPFTADDVIFTWEFAADPATGATTTGTYADIEHIDKLDEHTVKVVFKEPTPFWYDAFFGNRGHILPKHLFAPYKGQEARNAPYNLKPVGTGPYKIVEFKPGDVALYEINTQYHVPNRPFFDTVELKGGGDATSAARAVLQTGEFDFAWNMQVEHQVLSGLERGGKGRVLVTPGAGIEHIQVNFTDPWTEVDGERSSLNVSSLCRDARTGAACQRPDHRSIGNDLPQQFQSFRPQQGREKHHAGDVAVRSIKAADQAGGDRVAAAGENKRHGGCRSLDLYCCNGIRHDDG